MNYNINGKNMDLSERTKEKISGKLNRIQKLFPENTSARVVVRQEKLNSIVEVTIPVAKHLLRAEASASEMMAAVDKTVDILEKQIVKYKKRMISRQRQNPGIKDTSGIIGFDSNEFNEELPVFKIEKNKKFELRPMDVEEAVMEMELLGHNFFVFRDGLTESVNVVYKRKDGGFGLIESEV